MIKIEAIQHNDVRGKELFYLKLTKGEASVLINVGKKTHDSVKELETAPEQQELPLAGNLEDAVNKLKKGGK